METEVIFRPIFGLCLCLTMVTSCSIMHWTPPPPGPSYASIQNTLPAIPQDKARIIFFRQPAYVGSRMEMQISESGHSVGLLYDGSVLYADLILGHHDFIISNPNPISIGHNRFRIDTPVSDTYYVELYVPGVEIPLLSGGAANLPGSKPVQSGEDMGTSCSMDICCHLVDAASVRSVLGGLIFEADSGLSR